MSEHSRNPSSRRVGLALLTALGGFLVLTAGLFAATYVIDTNDNRVTEWTDQGIVVFQTDPAGDGIAPGGGPISPTDDIVTAWVANATIPPTTGQDTPSLAFRVQTAAPPSASQPLRAVAAILDCDRNGLDNERQDRWVVYNTTGPQTDAVSLYTGDLAYGLVPTAVLPKFLGERVINNLEWAIPISELPIRGDEPPELGQVVDCRHKVNIRIATMQFVTPTGFVVLDTVLPSIGWDISTGKPLPAELTISQPVETDDVLLEWNATGQSAAYDVLRSTAGPYEGFTSCGSTVETLFTDLAAVTQPEPAFFYQVQGTTGGVATVDPSNTVGIYKFALIPGAAEP